MIQTCAPTRDNFYTIRILIEYWSVMSPNFLFAFQHFHDHISEEHDENPHTPNLTWIGSW